MFSRCREVTPRYSAACLVSKYRCLIATLLRCFIYTFSFYVHSLLFMYTPYHSIYTPYYLCTPLPFISTLYHFCTLPSSYSLHIITHTSECHKAGVSSELECPQSLIHPLILGNYPSIQENHRERWLGVQLRVCLSPTSY